LGGQYGFGIKQVFSDHKTNEKSVEPPFLQEERKKERKKERKRRKRRKRRERRKRRRKKRQKWK